MQQLLRVKTGEILVFKYFILRYRHMEIGLTIRGMEKFGSQGFRAVSGHIEIADIGYGLRCMNGYGYRIMSGAGHRFIMEDGS
jgi:hypothetical protein